MFLNLQFFIGIEKVKYKINIMDKFNEIKELMETAELDVKKFFEKGNKSAAVRVRKAMQEIKNLAQELRVLVQETKNNM